MIKDLYTNFNVNNYSYVIPKLLTLTKNMVYDIEQETCDDYSFEQLVNNIIKKEQLEENFIKHILNEFGIKYIKLIFDYQNNVPNLLDYFDELKFEIGLYLCDYWDSNNFTKEILSHTKFYDYINWNRLIEIQCDNLTKAQFRKQITKVKVRIFFTKKISINNYLTKSKYVIVSMPYNEDVYFDYNFTDDITTTRNNENNENTDSENTDSESSSNDNELLEHQYIGILCDNNKKSLNAIIDNLIHGGYYLATGKIKRSNRNITTIAISNKFNYNLTESSKIKYYLLMQSIIHFFNGNANEITLDSKPWCI